MNQAPTTANATFSATLVDQWVIEGLTHAFVAPGSRSTPLALALVAHRGIDVALFHDERGAAFAALGHGLATGRPAVVICTSGTAAAHFFAAVIEADASAVPLIVCTGDRPPELWGRGAPQTIDQTALFGSKVRAFIEPGPPDDTEPDTWRLIASEAWKQATGRTPGPVHCNLSFRDPLTGNAGPLPAALPKTAIEPARVVDPLDVAAIAARFRGGRGVIIAGRNETSGDDIIELARRLGWPIIADHRSGCRRADADLVMQRFDALLREPEFGHAHEPDVVFRIGEIVSSKAVSQWLAAWAGDVVATRPHGRNIDPENIATTQIDETGLVASLLTTLDGGDRCAAGWLTSWIEADHDALETSRGVIAAAGVHNEIAAAQAVVEAVPPGGALVVSSSMPVRDVEWFGPSRDDIDVYANRGANGIDGVVATAIGVALTQTPTICLIGDVALLHDSTSLIALRKRPIDLTIVAVDNDGGGIFSFLPQHELLTVGDYELLFGTPHGTDLHALCKAHGLLSLDWPAPLAPSGIRIVIVDSDRDLNEALHGAVNHAVADRFTGRAGARPTTT